MITSSVGIHSHHNMKFSEHFSIVYLRTFSEIIILSDNSDRTYKKTTIFENSCSFHHNFMAVWELHYCNCFSSPQQIWRQQLQIRFSGVKIVISVPYKNDREFRKGNVLLWKLWHVSPRCQTGFTKAFMGDIIFWFTSLTRSLGHSCRRGNTKQSAW